MFGAETGKVERTDRNLSRRNFIKGIIAVGAAVSSTTYLFGNMSSVATPVRARAADSVARLLGLRVNGRTRRVDVLPHETLAMTLRYRLGLTGTKLGCDRATCGACTVLIDGVNEYSCSILTHTVRDQEIVTIEGVGSESGKLHPVQQAFIDELAPQCGYCIPGMIVSAVSLLNSNSNPTQEEVALSLSGNLCRCGGYENIVSAVMRAAEVNRVG